MGETIPMCCGKPMMPVQEVSAQTKTVKVDSTLYECVYCCWKCARPRAYRPLTPGEIFKYEMGIK